MLCHKDEGSSDGLDCTQTQQSSMFYTPKHQLSNHTSYGEERSQVKISNFRYFLDTLYIMQKQNKEMIRPMP